MPDPLLLSVQIPSNTTEGLAVQEQIIALMEKAEYSMRDVFAMRLTLEEAITNAIKHGNKGDLNKSVQIDARVSEVGLEVTVEDEGEGFNPEAVPDPTDEEFINRDCGRGLLLLNAYLDEVCYSDDGRRVTLKRERNSQLPIIDDDDD